MDVFQSNERRLVLRLLEYWQFVRGNKRDFPKLDDIQSTALGKDWASSFMIDISPDIDQSRFIYVGEEFSRFYPDDMIGKSIQDCRSNALLYHAVSYLGRMVEKRVPISLGNELAQGSNMLLYRSILLPLSEDGKLINRVFGGANAKLVQRS